MEAALQQQFALGGMNQLDALGGRLVTVRGIDDLVA
jgi:hypothetical protein